MAISTEDIRKGAVLVSGLIYWVGVLVQAYRLKRRTGRSPNLRPKGLKERLLWMGWLFVIAGWVGQPLLMRGLGKVPFFWTPDVLLAEVGKVSGLGLLILGYVGTIWCYRILGDSWRIGVNRKEQTILIRTGPYRFVRHPIYVFQIIMLLGVTLLLPTPFSLLILGVHLLCVIIKATDEEHYLVTVHGAAYQEYAFQTGCLLPRLTCHKTPSEGGVSMGAGSIPSPKQRKKKSGKSKLLKLFEFGAVYALLSVVRIMPMTCISAVSTSLGALFFFISPKRRGIAIGNITSAFGEDKTPEEIRQIARESFRSFFLTFMEIIKFQHLFDGQDAADRIRNTAEDLEALFQKAKAVHDESKGCIFVTPHIGNWEVLPRVSRLVGIPLVVVARPLDNEYLNDLLLKKRAVSGQIIMPKRNSFFALQETLKKGKSIGLLPDQSTMKGILVDFFGRKATTTPVPALLAISHRRPIVVVACCRREGGQFEGFVCDPIWPKDYDSEKTEIFRLTQEMNRNMEMIIRKYPGQYLWMHNRWKTYKNKKEFYS